MEATILILILNLVIIVINLARLLSPIVQNLYKPRLQKSRRKRRYGNDIYQLEAKLLTLLQGDTSTAKRLLKQVRVMHPGRDAKWYLEKVIWDLERDRY